MSNPRLEKGGCATSQGSGLPPQGCATSPRGAHLSKHMCSKALKPIINQLPINLGLSHLTISLTFVPSFVFNHVPTCSFIFALADFLLILFDFFGFLRVKLILSD
jgi:hypothetical protein